ncbi:transcription factor grauzone-like [Sergentomyia squamirostris]
MDFPGIKREESAVCRVCLAQNAAYLNIFGENLIYPEIANDLRELLQISISPLDNWPKRLCTNCLSQIQEFRALLTRVKESQEHLVELFGEYELVSAPESLEESVKVEISEDVKEEESEPTPESDRDFSEPPEEEEEPGPSTKVKRKRGRPKLTEREKMKRGRRPKRRHSEDETSDQEASVDGKLTEEQLKEKEERRLRDEKVDEEIHAFFKMECIICSIKFARFCDVQAHFRATHKCRGYVVCCGKKLNRPMKLWEHMNDHINPQKHQCCVCEKFYTTAAGLQIHKKLQHTPPELRKFRCDLCPQTFAQLFALKAHMITHMAPEEKKHICATCGRAFALATILVQHVRRVHENACVNVCEICAKVFRSKNLFEKHVQEHSAGGLPRVPCNICGKTFKHKIAMQRHRYRHDTSGSLECHICQRTAPNRQALLEHIKYNHRERKLRNCTLCERSFKNTKALKEHMATHTGQVLYHCLFCPKNFNSNANYFRHNKMSHPVEWEAEKEKRRLERINQKKE